MKKVIFITALIAAGLIFSGCGNTTSSRNNTTQPVQPEPTPTPKPEPKPDPEPGVPGIGTGSVSYNPSCQSGFATVTYIYREDANIDSNSFVIIHSVNNIRESITSASVFNNGSVAMVEEQIYIQENDTDKQKAHQIRVDFIADGVSQVQSFSFIQPACIVDEPEIPVDDNTTAVIMSVNIK